MKDKQDRNRSVSKFRYPKYAALQNMEERKEFLMEDIKLPIPKIPNDPDPIELTLKSGNQLFIVGANGSGKSALMQRFAVQTGGNKIKWIAAHRQTWFESGTISLTPARRERYESEEQNYNTSNDARYKDTKASQNLSAILFDLDDKEIDRAFTIIRHLGDDDCTKARKAYIELPSPLDQINELLSLGTFTVTLEKSESRGRNLLAKHPQGAPFSIVEMSDGERNAMIIAAHVITAEPGTVLLIDEPERHLHRSIIQPFLSALFALRREDCAFIIATHEIALPIANPEAQVLMLRSCRWHGSQCVAWDADVLKPNAELPEDLKLAILGSRKKILFVEGQPGGPDFSLYTVLFPELSVVPQKSCEEVQNAVLGWRGSQGIHPVHVEIFGLIDRDNRSDEEVEELAEKGIFALEVYSVEGLYYCSDAIAAVAEQQAKLRDEDEAKLIELARQKAIEDLKIHAEEMAARMCERKIQNLVVSNVPDWKSIKANPLQSICVPIDSRLYDNEFDYFNKLVEEKDLDQLVARYPVHKTGALAAIAKALKCRNKNDYQQIVLAQVQKDGQLACKLKERIRLLSEVLDQVENPQTT